MTSDGRVARGDRTRTAALDAAVSLATEVGLDGLSLGQLADRLGVSKSGLFAHWRSKEALQLATVERAVAQWQERIVAPALRAPRGVRRLRALHEARIDFYAARVLPGSCFFANTEFEYNARPGPVRDRLAAAFGSWTALLERLVQEAVDLGELPADLDVAQLAYEIDALGISAAMRSRLLEPEATYRHARQGLLTRLRALCPDPTLLTEGP
ncbi:MULTISPECIES: TetR/AcrR family transcriptional regulator [Micromonospora]|uniref:TetR/AcrR family transcriptional regulator n=1 Tax=Micromonospora solifontis TaxID=2487138 RepID=A0ABX9WC15_9ACTN|nr:MULTISPECIES: TetR/AcrR family transcriptional regulator [Micromonospora]NES16458.1 TetR/AcrR family transcriptional regulator [Micromonospora sp. PPF5-17B]NES39265.1 TetR/AcrR family transcriptional regulator [Micromonospora solifontis]NES58146.1 TetR/AcrR family transcriptional regulator [Micromonospora sp. PPF5-6]RNL89805.1 TetR/AcrR family transcriptional regulator [Micromonospora solifontis]